MANKKINELVTRTPSLSDLMLVGDPSSGYSYKCTITSLATIIETDIADGYVTLTTAQTISGAKTFSNILTLTSVANATTDPDKFLVLNASNVVNYRTGSEVLSDIGAQGALTLTTTGTSGAATLVGNTLNIPQYTDQYIGTVTSVAMSVPTGLSVSGSPITTSGTLAVSLQSGYSIPTTASQSNWDSAYNNMIVSAAVTGTTTKTLTLTQQDAGTITASWTDDNTDAVTSVFGRTGAVVATEGDYSLTQLSDVTITTPTNGQVLKYNGTTWVNDTDANTGTVTSVAMSVPTGLSVSGSPITSSGTLAVTFSSGYSIPTTASQTNWDTAYTNRITSLTTTGSSGAATLVSNTLNIPNYTLAGLGGVSGSGTTYRVAMFTGTSSIGNSTLYYDINTDNIGIGALPPPLYSRRALGLSDNGFSGNSSLWEITKNVTYTDGYRYLSSGSASMYKYEGGTFSWNFASSGSANNVITWTEVLKLTSGGNLTIGGISNATTDTDKFLVSDNGEVKYRTGSEVLSDIGAAASTSISGTTNYIPKFTSSSAIGNSSIQDNGTLVTITSNTAGNSTLNLISSNSVNSGKIQFGGATFGATIEKNSLGADNGLIFNSYHAGAEGYTFQSNGTNVMKLSASGNLGLGVTPSASTIPQFEGGSNLILTGRGNAYFGNNVTFNGGWQYINSSTAGQYQISGNAHYWYQAASGTAGNAITFTQAMTLDASGRLAVGLTNPVAKFHVENPSSADPTSLSSTPTTNIFGMSTSPGGMLAAGIGATGGTYVWLQGRNVGGAGVSYPISLQPLGGNVGIGTTSPAVLLDAVSAVTGTYGSSTQQVVARLYNSPASLGSGNNSAFLSLQTTADGGSSNPVARIGVVGESYGSNNGAFVVATRDGSGISEKMRITSAGNVGIGTTSPQRILTVYNSNAATLYQTPTSGTGANDGFYVGQVGDVSYVWNYNSFPLAFGTAATERMRITSGGYVGINEQTPNSYLHVKGSLRLPITTKSATYTLTADDYTVGFDCTSANRTANLPDATTCGGRIYVIYQFGGGSTTGVTIDGNGAQTINGSATYVLQGYCDYSSVMIQSDGSNWVVISDALQTGCL